MADKMTGQAQAAPPADAKDLIARHAGAAEPVWLWDRRRNRIVWGNAAAVAFWDAGSLLDLVEFRFVAGSPEARLGNGLKDGEEREAILSPKGEPLRAQMRAEAVVLFDGSEGTLVEVLKRLPPAADPGVARKAALFDAAPVALFQLDDDGTVIEANAAATDVLAIVVRDRLAAIARQVLKTGSANTVIRGSDGSNDRSWRLNAMRLEQGEILVRADDVTDRLYLEGLKQQPPPGPTKKTEPVSQPEGGPGPDRLIANLSHEMRNPLNAIIGFSEVMQQRRFGPLGNHRYEGYVDDIRMSADHLLSLINDLLDIGSLAEGRYKVDFQSVSLTTLVAECLRMLERLAGEMGVAVDTEFEASLPPVVADARAMKQVLLNVLSNAIRFTPAGGKVAVRGELGEEGGLTLTIRDSGVGMNGDELARALEPYGQVEGALQRRSKGTGLGLPLSRALAEATKCDFRIESAKGRGTTVTLSFPANRVLAG